MPPMRDVCLRGETCASEERRMPPRRDVCLRGETCASEERRVPPRRDVCLRGETCASEERRVPPTPPVRQQPVSADSDGGFTPVFICLLFGFRALCALGGGLGFCGSDTPFPEVYVKCESREARDLVV